MTPDPNNCRTAMLFLTVKTSILASCIYKQAATEANPTALGLFARNICIITVVNLLATKADF